MSGLAAAAAPAGIGLIGSMISNKKNRKHAEKMYKMQRDDAIKFWNMQNAYNSPEQQMKRLEMAGLNPNLVYGSGSGGASGTASTIDTPDVQPVQHRYPSGENFNLMAEYFNTKIKQAQYDNLQLENTNKTEDILMKQAQRQKVGVTTEQKRFDLTLARNLEQTSMDMATERLRKQQIQNTNAISQEERNAAMHTKSLEEAAQRILNLRKQRAKTGKEIKQIETTIRNLKKEGVLKDWEIRMSRQNITKSDPLYWRMLADLLGYTGGGMKSFIQPFKN